MKGLTTTLILVLVISTIPTIYATHFGDCKHTDLECIATFDDATDFGDPSFAGTGTTIISGTFQGTNSDPNSMSSLSWLEWTLNYQDGSETGRTDLTPATFEAFPLSFVDQTQTFRTLINAEVIGVTSFAGLSDNLCHDLPRQNFKSEIFVNGKLVNVPKQLFGSNNFNEDTSINRGFGVKITPAFVESVLESSGTPLGTGDVVTWKVTSDTRYTLYSGKVTAGTCEAIRGTAWDAYTVGMTFSINFLWVDAIDLITRPTTGEPDLDGDGIPDDIDQCDFSGERFNGFQDEDGCPDNDPIGFDSSSIQDQDGDGILDADDLCPNDGENFNGVDDGDGCPDGSILDSGFASTPITEPIEPLVQQEPIVTELPFIETPDIENVELIEENPMTMFHVEENTEPTTTAGISDNCDQSVNNCDQVILDALTNFEQRTGIQLPFPPTILNLMLILSGIFGVVIVSAILIRRFRK